VPVTGIVLQKSCHVFSLSPHTDESYLFKMLACQGSLYGKPHAYCGSLTLAVHLCVLHECRQFRTVKIHQQIALFYKCGNMFQIFVKPSSGYSKKTYRGLYAVNLKSSKNGTENSNLCWYCSENSILEQL
jgi:hypothetical protein